MRMICVVLFCAAAVFAQPLHAEVTLDQTTKDFLEGMWAADGEPAHETLCAGKDAGGTQLGIEFTNSGGSLLLYTPFDIFSRGVITEARRDGDVVTLVARFVEDREHKDRRIRARIVAPNRLVLIEAISGRVQAPNDPVVVEYRCQISNKGVTRRLSPEIVRSFTSPGEEYFAFVVRDATAVTQEESCKSAAASGKTPYFAMDLIGPDIFYSVNFGAPVRLRDFYILGGTTDAGGYVQLLTSQDDLPILTFEIQDDGTVKIRELEKIFVRCAVGSDGKISAKPIKR